MQDYSEETLKKVFPRMYKYIIFFLVKTKIGNQQIFLDDGYQDHAILLNEADGHTKLTDIALKEGLL